MADATGAGSQTGGRDLLALLALVAVVQTLLSYRTLLGDGGALFVDNVLWPFLAIASLVYWSGQLRTSTVKLGVCTGGATLASASFVADPVPAKLLAASALVVAGVFYALDVFADGDGRTIASP